MIYCRRCLRERTVSAGVRFGRIYVDAYAAMCAAVCDETAVVTGGGISRCSSMVLALLQSPLASGINAPWPKTH
ncbi:hypothetical protein TNCV_627791 [Trichonephila clavipes]|nr:hypothetical protein TNCV_627791 [Trichonephila clavipes]